MTSSFVLSFIPSPSSGTFDIGILSVHAYGLFIAFGVVAAVALARFRWKALGQNPDDISDIAIWSVPAGIIGARIYHVITDWQLYKDRPQDIFLIWSGGLGIWGGIAAGVAVGVLVARRKGLNTLLLLDAVAPGIVLAQAIGRFGNYFNQELFGKPTTLPWGLKIDAAHRPLEYFSYSTFHPTFLYESLLNLGICGLLLLLSRKSLKNGTVFAVYVAIYTFARFFIERLRIDPANHIFGMRLNEWTSLIIFMGAILYLISQSLRVQQSSPKG